MWLPVVGVAVVPVVLVVDVLLRVAADRNTLPLHRMTEQTARCRAVLLNYPRLTVMMHRKEGWGGGAAV